MAVNIMRIENEDIVTDDIFPIVFEHFPDIVHSVDSDGNIVFTNKKAESLLGYTRDELLSMNIRDLYADEVLDALQAGFQTLKREGEKTVESVLKDRDGQRIPVEIRSFSIYDNNGNFIRTFSILRDIRQVKELQESLIHSARLAAVGELASGIVHDINNPLNIISMCTQMGTKLLAEHGTEGEPALETIVAYTADIQRAAASIQKLVAHLKNFSRGVAETRELVDIEKSVGDALFLMSSKVKQSKVSVECDVERGLHYTLANANQLEQVFANLVSNACDALEACDERTVTIRVEPCVRDADCYWKCTVHDTGSGIAPDLQQDIFRSFYTTKAKGKGTGLGLSIVRGIVRDHNGHIEVVSDPSRGTTFTVYLLQADPSQSPKSQLLLLPRES